MFFFFLLPSELQLNCWISQKFWLWLAALYHMMETISLVSPHFTVFLRAAWNGTFHLPGFVNAQMCWGLSRSNAPRQRKKKKNEKKSVLPLKSWWHVRLACLGEWQLWIWSCQVVLWQRVKTLREARFDFLRVWITSRHLNTYRCHLMFGCSQIKREEENTLKRCNNSSF